MLLDSPLRDDELLARIEAVGYRATAISQSLLERLLQALPNAGFRQFYGQTETGASVAVLWPDYHVLSGPRSGPLTSCGQPCADLEFETHATAGHPTPLRPPGPGRVRGAFLPPAN